MGGSHQNANSSIVDDTDPRFTYSNAWALIGSASDHNFTSHGTNVTGSTVVLSFNGTSLIIYGTVTPTNENGPPVSSYSIDNGPASMYTAPITNSSLFGLQFYGSRRLTADIHNLTITVESTKPSEYWLDYALIFDETADDSSSKVRLEVEAIVGGVVGGIICFILIGLLLLWYRRYRHNRGVKIASITHGFDLRPAIDESPERMSPAPLPRPKSFPVVSIPQPAAGPYSPPGTSSSTSSHPHSPIYGGSGFYHSLAPQGPYSPPGTGSSTSSYPAYGPGSLAHHGLIPIDISQSQPAPNPIPTSSILLNPTPASPSSDQPPSDQSRPRRRKSRPRPSPPPATLPPAPRLHEDAGIRLEGGRLNDPEAMIDVPPAYREY